MIGLKEQLKKKYIRFILLTVSGIITGITVCFAELGLLEWISMIPLFLVMLSFSDERERRLRSMYAYGLFYFMVYFVTCWHWFFAMYPMSYTGMNEFAAFTVLLAAVLGLPFLQSLGYAFVFVLFLIVARGRTAQKYPILLTAVFAALYTIFEWMQTLFWFGVPWGRLSLGQTHTLITVQTASWFGCYFVTFLLVAVNACLAYAIYKTEKRRLAATLACAMFTFNVIAGVSMMLFEDRESSGTVKVAAIQGNISSAEKWSYDWFVKTQASYEKLTRQAADDGAQIVIWPETVLPVFIENTPNAYRFITDLADDCDIVLMVGTISAGDDDGQYNTVVTILPDGSVAEEYYYKQHLVPFGEYVPYYALICAVIPALADVNVLEKDFTTAESYLTVDTGVGKVGSALCFDSIYENTVRKTVKSGAQFIAIETNDSWFFDSAAVEMHKSQAILRAIENRRYVARSANTGISAIINEKGEVLKEVAALEKGYAISEIELYDNFSLYTVIGNLFVYILIVSVVSIIGVDVFIYIRKRR